MIIEESEHRYERSGRNLACRRPAHWLRSAGRWILALMMLAAFPGASWVEGAQEGSEFETTHVQLETGDGKEIEGYLQHTVNTRLALDVLLLEMPRTS